MHRSRQSVHTLQSGSILVEVVIASGIVLMTIVGTITTLSYLYRSSINNMAYIQAAFIGEEGLEVARILRDNGWATRIVPLTPGANFYVYFDGTKWLSTSTNMFIDQTFERRVVFDNVYRDNSQNIVSSGGTLDANIRKVTAFVSWSTQGATTTRSFSTYLADTFRN